MKLHLGVLSPRCQATIRNLLVASLLAGALLTPVNEAVQAEIIPTGDIFELSITEDNLKASRRWETPKLQFPKVMNGRGDCDDASRPDLNPNDLEEDSTTCFDYTLRVSYPPSLEPVRLRVGLRTLNAITGTQLAAADGWDVSLIDPRGRPRGGVRVGGPTPSRDVSEVVASRVVGANPPLDPGRRLFDLGPPEEDAGDWTVRVAAFEVNKLPPPDSETPFIFPRGTCTGDPEQQFCEATFAELRAILEAEDHGTVEAKPLLPDLEAIPPFGMQFGCQPPASSAPEEPAAVCLRAAFGYGNLGDGPLELKVTPRAEDVVVADVRQRVFRRDATPWSYRDNEDDGLFDDFDAGTASFHATHGHWHYDNIFTAQLIKVTEDGTLEGDPVVTAKRGNCAHDGILLRWKHTFFTEAKETNDSGEDCSGLGTDSPTGIRIGLSRGWADVYAASLPDQYFDFSNLGDGTYLAQFEVDPGGLITELNEKNNFGYTLFKVENFVAPGSTANVTILERGRGQSHLDPKKVLLFSIAE